MLITIAGKGGSGKSTVAKILAKKLRYRFFSAGDFRGSIALKHGLTIDQLNDIGKKEFWTDKIVDDEIKRIGQKEDNIVIDAWIGFHFIPNSFKVFLDVDENTASKRIFKDQRPDEPKKSTIKEIKEMNKSRLKDNLDRYKHYYKIDLLKKSNYDLIIDTTNLTPEQIVDMIIKRIK